jgi:acyl-CoA thioesterase-2
VTSEPSTDEHLDPAAAVAGLVRDLTPEPLGDDRFAAVAAPQVRTHLFGGLVAGQALAAAYRTVDDDRQVASVHAYFLRAGVVGEPLELRVERDSDGRSFSSRRVTVTQRDRTIFSMIALFHVPEESPEILRPLPPGVPPPLALPRKTGGPLFAGDAIEVRELLPDRPADGFHLPDWYWTRVAAPLPDDPALHACLLLFTSDTGCPWPYNVPDGWGTGASLDHALWIHRPTRMDRWHFVATEIGSLGDSRGLYLARIFDEDGRQVATVAQENLVRPSADGFVRRGR